jgi:ribulose-phosphate 3-epimerase
MNQNLLSTSILSADFAALEDQLRQVEKAGGDWIHIDVMDGHFVPNITMGPFIVETCHRITRLPLDVHLMINDSERYVVPFIQAGASNVTIHIEENPNVARTLQEIRRLGAHPGVALNPGTPASAIEAILPFVDMILVMTVNPGFSGQKFIPESLSKISTVRHMIERSSLPIRLEVDGGIGRDLAMQCIAAGADTFVAATAIFKHPGGIAAGISEFKQAFK